MVQKTAQSTPASRSKVLVRVAGREFFDEFSRAPVFTNEERAIASVKAVGFYFSASAKLKILVAACGVPDERGSPIVNALAEAFPNSRIVATDIAYPPGGFLRPANSRFAMHDMINGNVREGRFDVVHCTNFLYHLGSEIRERVVRKLVSEVKPGGLLIVDNDNMWGAEYAVRDAGKEVRIEGLGKFFSDTSVSMDRRLALVPIQKD